MKRIWALLLTLLLVAGLVPHTFAEEQISIEFWTLALQQIYQQKKLPSLLCLTRIQTHLAPSTCVCQTGHLSAKTGRQNTVAALFSAERY